MTIIFLVSSVVPHFYMNADDALGYVKRWRPRADKNIVSITDMNSYALARLRLSLGDCIGMVVSAHNNAYVIQCSPYTLPVSDHRAGRHPDHYLTAILWGSPDADRLASLRDLRKWYAYCHAIVSSNAATPPSVLHGDLIVNKTERDLWSVAVVNEEEA